MSYGTGVKLGKFFNNYMYKEEKKTFHEERQGIRQDNAYITLYGRSEYNKLSNHEKKSRGYWD